MDIALGSSGMLVLKDDGSVICSGDNSMGQISIPSEAQQGLVSVSAGPGYFLALKKNGSVIAWGDGSAAMTQVPVGASFGIISIAAGGSVATAVRCDGKILVWGGNFYGVNFPSTVPGAKAIMAGGGHALVLKSDGSVLGSGWNYAGQASVPSYLQGRIAAISAAGDRTMFLADYQVSLKADVNATAMVLSWPIVDHRYVLQSSPVFGAGAVWMDMTNQPMWMGITNNSVYVGEEFVVTNSLSGGPRWYRLHRP